jgi:hypothetical protein
MQPARGIWTRLSFSSLQPSNKGISGVKIRHVRKANRLHDCLHMRMRKEMGAFARKEAESKEPQRQKCGCGRMVVLQRGFVYSTKLATGQSG